LVILSCHAAIALGTMFGGWRIVKTMGSGITRLQPVGGFCAETARPPTIIGAHALRHSDLDHARDHRVDPRRRHDARRAIGAMDLGQRIVLAWVLTLPCAAFMALITYFIIHLTIEPLFR
jgi:PiT family inorganic phosphate transporter